MSWLALAQGLRDSNPRTPEQFPFSYFFLFSFRNRLD
jgi:hypothetical protein